MYFTLLFKIVTKINKLYLICFHMRNKNKKINNMVFAIVLLKISLNRSRYDPALYSLLIMSAESVAPIESIVKPKKSVYMKYKH
jgi:hypothetical protein